MAAFGAKKAKYPEVSRRDNNGRGTGDARQRNGTERRAARAHHRPHRPPLSVHSTRVAVQRSVVQCTPVHSIAVEGGAHALVATTSAMAHRPVIDQTHRRRSTWTLDAQPASSILIHPPLCSLLFSLHCVALCRQKSLNGAYTYDLLVIGGGSGGLAASKEAAHCHEGREGTRAHTHTQICTMVCARGNEPCCSW